MTDCYERLKRRVGELWKEEGLLTGKILIQARALTTKEAIGSPENDDFPLQKGKERLMQASFLNVTGQAFTDMYDDFEGTLKEVLELPMEDNYQRAVFVASLNATLRYLGQIGRTVHCRDQEPGICGAELAQHLKDINDKMKIAQVGFQPRMVESLAPNFPLRVLDMDPDNICTRKFKITIEGPENTEDAIQWADLLLVTGTTLVNGTIEPFLGRKPVLFYGTTIAGAAHVMGWDRFCPRSR